MGSPLPLPEQPKTPAHERANIRGRAFFMRKGMPIRCSSSGRHDCLYQCFLNFTQKKTPRRDLIVTKFFGSMLMEFI